MTTARQHLVDSSVTPFYHCISRCVRRAFLCGEGAEHRKQWIENRLRELSEIFAIGVCGYAVMDNHLHVVLQLNDRVAAEWADDEVARRWGRLFPPRGKDRQPLDVSESWVAERIKDKAWIASARERLNSLGWFMKCLKEPLSRLANHEDNCRGTFWEARFKSIAILDEEALLTTLAYVDLNPVAAGVAKTPEQSAHTSVKARVDHCREQGTLEQVVDQPQDRTRHDAAQEDESFWLVPLQDRRETDGTRAGVSASMNLASYLRLLDWSSRLVRRGKARVTSDVKQILDRLGTGPGQWQERLEKLTAADRIFGVVFATKVKSINDFAESRGVRKLSNLNGCARRT
jgi:REP element-mobilizing transposase RayT